MANTRHITVDDLQTVMKGMGDLNDARFLKKTDAGDLAELDEVSKGNLNSELSSEIDGKANSATTLAGYGITDAYTKEEVDAKLTSVYKIKGSKVAAELVSALLTSENEGNVYNIADALTTTADFIEGAGKTHPAGVNVVIVNIGTSTNPIYRFDVLAGMLDLSNYATKEESAPANTVTELTTTVEKTQEDVDKLSEKIAAIEENTATAEDVYNILAKVYD